MAEAQLQILRDAVDRSWGVPDRGRGWQPLPGVGDGQAALSRAFVQMSEGDLVRTVDLLDGSVGPYRVRVGERLETLPEPSEIPRMRRIFWGKPGDWEAAWGPDLLPDEVAVVGWECGVDGRVVVTALLDCFSVVSPRSLDGPGRACLVMLRRWLADPERWLDRVRALLRKVWNGSSLEAALFTMARVVLAHHGIGRQGLQRWAVSDFFINMTRIRRDNVLAGDWASDRGVEPGFTAAMLATFRRRVSLRVLLYSLARTMRR